MNNEKYNQIIDDAYKNYIKWANEHSKTHLYEPHTQEEFINKCKTDSESSSKWGLKIEERELSLEERVRIYALKEGQTYEEFVTNWNTDVQWNEDLNDTNTPTKLITLTYNNETIESYES